MSKTQAWWWFTGIAVVMIGISIFTEIYESDIGWLNKVLGLFGVLLSLGGVIMALVQIKQADVQIKESAKNIVTVAETTAKIQQAVDENRKEIRDFLSISEVVHLVETIRNAQVHIRQQSYSNAVLLLQMIKDDLIRTNAQFTELIIQSSIDMIDLIRQLSLDIESLTKYGIYMQGASEINPSLKPEVIHKNLENAREAVIKIESYLKKNKI